ncbi:MAG: hypothetical protein LH631_14840 [Alkalinema sp. CAN_BIN05]|nr:hypothetical protein [Alkalinema sp. CAN_BIN05]
MLTQTSPLQVAIESVEALAEDEQDLVFDLIRKRRIELRRKAIAQSAIETMQAIENGTAKCGTAAEVMADIFGDDE